MPQPSEPSSKDTFPWLKVPETMEEGANQRKKILSITAEQPHTWLEAWKDADAEHRLLLASSLTVLKMLDRESGWGSMAAPASTRITPAQESALCAALCDTSEDKEVRQEAAMVLGEAGGISLIPDLAKVAESDPDLHLRSLTYRALGMIGGPEALAPLLRGMQREPDTIPLVTIICHLGHLSLDADDNVLKGIQDGLTALADRADAPLLARLAAQYAASPSYLAELRADLARSQTQR